MVSLRNDRRRKKKAVRTPSGTNLQGIGAENDEEILPSAEKIDRQGPHISVRVSDVENAAADDSGPKSVETRVCGKIDTGKNVNRFLDNTEIRATVSNGKEGRRMPGLQSSGVDDDEDNIPIGRVLIRKKTGVAFKRKRERLDDGSSANNTGGNNCPVKRAVAMESASVQNRDIHVKIEQDSDACGQSLWQGFQEGDMVWAKVKSHPWWPGQVYNPAFASATARRSRKPGHMLIAFFGDSSYGWFMQSDLIPFEPNFAQKSKQSTSRNFSKAVEEAVDEVSRRAMLGLMCACQNPNFFKPAKREGYVAVNAKGYEMAVLYTHRQIEMARNAFQPRKLISFARRMAASPWSGEEKGIPGIQSLAEIVAYRDATLVSMNRDYLDSLMNSKGSRAVVATSDAGDQTELGFESTHRDSTIKILAVDGKKDCISHAKATKSIVQGKTIDEKDKYLFKRREGVDENRSVGSKDHLLNPLVQINDLQIHASNPEALEEEASETDGIGQYVFQKRICSGDAQPIETKEERKQEDKGLIREFLMIGDSGTRKKEAVRKAFHMKESDTQNELDKSMFKQKGSGISEGEAGKRLPTDLQKKRVKKTGLTANSSMENACPGRALEAQGMGIIDDKLSEEEQCVATDTTFTGSGISEGEAGKSSPTDLQKKRGKKAGLTANSSTDNACPGRALEAQGIGTIDDKLSEEKQCVATDRTFTGSGISEGEAGKSLPTDLQKKRGKKTALTANSSMENACPGRALEAQGKVIIDDKLSEEKQCVATDTTFADGVEHLLCEEPLPKKHKQLSDVSSVPDFEVTNKLNELQSAHTSPVGAKGLFSGSGAEQGSESSPAPIKTPKLGITASEMTDSVKVDDKCASTDIDVHICNVVLPNVEEEDRITRNSIGCASGNAEKDCPGIVHDAFIESQITASAEVDESQISGTCHIDSRVPGTSGLMEGLQKNGFDGQEKDDSIPLSTETVKADNELSIVPANVNKTNYSFTSGLQSSANLDHAVIKKTKGFKRLVKFAKSSHSEDAFDNGIFPRKKNRLSDTNLPGNQQETERQINITDGVESTAEPQVDVKSGGADAYPGSPDHGIDAFAADDQGCSTILPDQVQGEKCPSRDLDPESPGLVLHQLLEDLLSLALDPFYGIDRDCPSKVCQAFLRFRSSVYQKSLSLPSSLEASKNGCSLLEVEDEEEIKHKFTVRASEPGLSLSDNKYVNAEDLFSNGNACSETDLVSSLNSKGQPRPQVLKIAKSRSLEIDILAKDNQKRKPDIQSDGLQSLKRLRKVKDLKPVDSLKPGLKQSGKKVLEVSRGDLKESVPQLKKTRLSSVVRPLDSRKTADDPMALCMKFPQGFALPSEVQLKARFARFGPLDISGTRIYCKTGSAQVVFKHSSDAEMAYKYATENCLFGQAEVHFRLKQIFQPKQENLLLQSNSEPLKLLKVRNDKILSLLPDVSEEDIPLSRSSDRHGVAEALVENTPKSTLQSRPLVQLKSCLKKPDESGNSTVKETARVTFLLDNEECRPEQDIAMDGSSRTENNTIPVSVPVPLENDAIAPFPIENNGLEPDPPDISHQMLHLLMKCNDIVSDVKRTLGYVPYLPV